MEDEENIVDRIKKALNEEDQTLDETDEQAREKQ